MQFGQVLTTLQSDTREDLQTFLREYSSALKREGAAGFNQAIKHWEDAYRNTSQVNDATRGTERRDLTQVLKGQGRVFGALSRDEDALKELVTDLNRTVAALRPPGGQPQRGDARAARRVPRGPPGAGLAEPRAARDPRLRARRPARRALLARRRSTPSCRSCARRAGWSPSARPRGSAARCYTTVPTWRG